MAVINQQALEASAQLKLEHAKYVQECWKAGLSILTPLAIAVLTYFVSTSLNRQQSNMRIAEQTLQLKQSAYTSLGVKLNKIFVYVADVGDYRSLKPPEIINLKRDADREFFMYQPFWSADTVQNYREFMNKAFITFIGSGKNAKINAFSQEKRSAYKFDHVEWIEAWDDMFSEKYPEKIFERYDSLVSSFLRDIASSTVK